HAQPTNGVFERRQPEERGAGDREFQAGGTAHHAAHTPVYDSLPWTGFTCRFDRGGLGGEEVRGIGRLDKSVAIVTGAGSGNGLAIATALAGEGCAVVIGEYSDERGAAAAEGITRAGGRARFVRTDVSRWADIDRLVGFTFREFGALHILVNNAGVLDGYATCLDTSDELFDRVIAINLKGVFFGCRRV